MEKINELLGKLENRVTPAIAKRLKGYEGLNQKVALAEAEHLENPTDESEESLNDIKEYVSEVLDDLIEDLENLVEVKNKKSEEKAEQQKAEQQKAEQQKAEQQKAEAEKAEAEKAKEEKAPVSVEPIKVVEKAEETKTEIVKEKKSGLGVVGLVIGVALLIGSVGAFNIMKTNR
jgi:cobalamin biosynthesis Mg chelatase CobN